MINQSVYRIKLQNHGKIIVSIFSEMLGVRLVKQLRVVGHIFNVVTCFAHLHKTHQCSLLKLLFKCSSFNLCFLGKPAMFSPLCPVVIPGMSDL